MQSINERFSLIVVSFVLGYCLQIDADERPDIYQVTQMACLLAGRDSLVANNNVRLSLSSA